MWQILGKNGKRYPKRYVGKKVKNYFQKLKEMPQNVKICWKGCQTIFSKTKAAFLPERLSKPLPGKNGTIASGKINASCMLAGLDWQNWFGNNSFPTLVVILALLSHCGMTRWLLCRLEGKAKNEEASNARGCPGAPVRSDSWDLPFFAMTRGRISKFFIMSSAAKTCACFIRTGVDCDRTSRNKKGRSSKFARDKWEY